MEPDPIALEAGLNMFAYAGNNPVMNVDPSGLMGVPSSMIPMTDYQMAIGLDQSLSALNNMQFSFESAASNFISAGISPDYSNLLAAKTRKPSGIRDSLLGYAESNGKTWHQEVAEFAISEYDRRNAPPPNLSPSGSGRQGAFNEAKRQSGIPTSQQPSTVTQNLDKRGNPQPGRQYDYQVPTSGGGTRTISIRDDSGGHDFGPNDPQNRGSHFNDPRGNHYDYRKRR